MAYSVTPSDIDQLLKQNEVIVTGHVVFHKNTRNEVHGRKYVNPRAIFRNYSVRFQLIQALFERIPSDIRHKVEVVAGPATGGAVTASDLSALLSTERQQGSASVATIFLTNDVNDYNIHDSDQEFLQGKKVLLVDDVRHTGRTFAVAGIRLAGVGAQVVATAEIVDRGMKVIPLASLSEDQNYYAVQLNQEKTYKPEDCPMCREKMEITKF